MSPHDSLHLKDNGNDPEALLSKDNFYEALASHMKIEEVMFKQNSDRMNAIEEDLRPIRRMYWAVVGSAFVGLLLLSSLVFIYTNDQVQTKDLQRNLYIQGTAIERLLERTAATDHSIDKIDLRVGNLENGKRK